MSDPGFTYGGSANTQLIQAENSRNKLLGQLISTLANISLSPYTSATVVANLPSASATPVGTRSFVTDATATTFASVVAGSGANKVPVYCDGTNWRIG